MLSSLPYGLSMRDTAFLIASGRAAMSDITTAHVCKWKADANKPLPGWWREHALLSKVLRNAWDTPGPQLLSRYFQALDFDGDGRINQKELKIGLRALRAYGKMAARASVLKSERILGAVQKRAYTYFREQTGSKSKSEASDWLRDRLQSQLSQFIEKYPERILHPRIIELVRQIEQDPRQRRVLLDSIKERLERLGARDDYWDNVSAVQVSFMWNASGIDIAEEKGISHYTILNPMDQKTCIVCKRMHGTTFSVKDARDHITRRASITNPDELKEAFPFPRNADLEHLTTGQLGKTDFKLPPYHNNCRDVIKYLYLA